MEGTIKIQTMLDYLQELLNCMERLKEKLGPDHDMTMNKFDEMIACKEMVEALIGQPVNLQKDGKVTVGF